MPGVTPALKTNNSVRSAREVINELAFSFVTPLGSNYNK
jgi:hypothetical protein